MVQSNGWMVRRLETAPQILEAWSVRPLPFEPRGEMFEFKQQIRKALSGLHSPDGRELHGTYISPSGERE
jgi:hypothetical protein